MIFSNQRCMRATATLFLLFIAACSQDTYRTEAPHKQTATQPARETDFNFDWRFKLISLEQGENIEIDKRISKPEYDDSQWATIQLPHDWSIAQTPDKKFNGATAYLPGGVAWYRKNFPTPTNSERSRVSVLFDGIYNHATVWINGVKLGYTVNGYIPIEYDLSPYLRTDGGQNTIAVHVDRSRYIDSRWYPGSGIYRNVKLIQSGKLHIPTYGTYITAESISQAQAKAKLALDIKNDGASNTEFSATTLVKDPSGNVVTQTTTHGSIAAGLSQTLEQDFIVKEPQRWDLAYPAQYLFETTISVNGKPTDTYQTKFGFRTIEFDKDNGFFLNGRKVLIKGVNLHHDAGLVGAAVPRKVWKRRFELLAKAGVNAIRTAHNPMSAEFMDLCDEMGFLVQAEIFDEWDNPKDKRLNQQERHDDYISRGLADWFQTHAKDDLNIAVKRDRNRPSIIMWSIGNEIEWTYPRYAAATGYFDMNASGNYFFNPPFISPEEINQRFHSSPENGYVLAKTAKKLSNWVKELDTTRPVTANLILPSVSHISGYTDALDIIGYSYRRVIYDYGHRLFPDKMIMGAENVVQWHEWKAIIERDFVAGTFLWTGTDYLGESHNHWPKKATSSGMLDLAGFTKPSYHMMKSLWSDEPHVHLTTQTVAKSPYKLGESDQLIYKKADAWKTYIWQWHDVNRHWNYANNELIAVEAYSNCDKLELLFNGVSQGVKALTSQEDRIFKWALPFAPGEIKVNGMGNCKTTDSLVSTSSPVNVAIDIDSPSLAIDGYDVAHVEIQLLDKNGNPVRHDEKKIRIEVSDELELLGIDNGSRSNIQTYNSNQVNTHLGRALTIVKAKTAGIGTLSIYLDNKLVSTKEIQTYLSN